MFKRMYLCVYPWMYTRIYVCMHEYVLVCIKIYVNMNVCIYIEFMHDGCLYLTLRKGFLFAWTHA